MFVLCRNLLFDLVSFLGGNMKRVIAAFLFVLVACMLTACNTVNGFGKDVEKVGEKMQGASTKR